MKAIQLLTTFKDCNFPTNKRKNYSTRILHMVAVIKRQDGWMLRYMNVPSCPGLLFVATWKAWTLGKKHLNWASVWPATFNNRPMGLQSSSVENVTLNNCPKRRSHCAKRFGSVWHIRKTNSSRVFCVTWGLCCLLLSPPGKKSFRSEQWELTGGGRVEDTDKSGSKSVAGDRGRHAVLLDGVAGCLFHPDEQHCG